MSRQPRIILVQNYPTSRSALYMNGWLQREEEGTTIRDGPRKFQNADQTMLHHLPDMLSLLGIPYRCLEADPIWVNRQKRFPQRLSQVQLVTG